MLVSSQIRGSEHESLTPTRPRWQDEDGRESAGHGPLGVTLKLSPRERQRLTDGGREGPCGSRCSAGRR